MQPDHSGGPNRRGWVVAGLALLILIALLVLWAMRPSRQGQPGQPGQTVHHESAAAVLVIDDAAGFAPLAGF